LGIPTVPYEILAEGYEVTSTKDRGFQATVNYITTWANAFTFHDDVMGYGQAVVVGPVTYSLPHKFPGAPNASMYAASCSITPCGPDGLAWADTAGLVPGEVWRYAKIKVTYETPQFPRDASDDPSGKNQLDPANPIYNCSQSVDINGRSETLAKEKYKFSGGDVEVPADLTVYRPEGKLVLEYQSVPFVAWKKYHPYIGKLNNAIFLDCGVGEAMFEGASIRNAPGSQGTLGKSVTLSFAVNPYDWNMILKDGTPTFVETKTGANKLYSYANFQDLLL
jgi:hypothetical protein